MKLMDSLTSYGIERGREFDSLDPAVLVELITVSFFDFAQHGPGRLAIGSPDQRVISEHSSRRDVHDGLKSHGKRNLECLAASASGATCSHVNILVRGY
jgi:hypothetical protein